MTPPKVAESAWVDLVDERLTRCLSRIVAKGYDLGTPARSRQTENFETGRSFLRSMKRSFETTINYA